MTVGEKIKTIDNKIEQNKTQFDLDRKTAAISVVYNQETWIFN